MWLLDSFSFSDWGGFGFWKQPSGLWKSWEFLSQSDWWVPLYVKRNSSKFAAFQASKTCMLRDCFSCYVTWPDPLKTAFKNVLKCWDNTWPPRSPSQTLQKGVNVYLGVCGKPMHWDDTVHLADFAAPYRDWKEVIVSPQPAAAQLSDVLWTYHHGIFRIHR